ncbi:MAG: protein-disulfide reductase DsbD N-terminal domain-containing protein [Chloracidobacterium sp.]|nr:protein-disulfide reductase DsbD N-terminal domain-containing protein [Chloracidobacterium sp.]
MFHRVMLFIAAAFGVLYLGAGSAAAQTVTASLATGSASKGSSVKGSVLISLPEGLHVNSNTPISEYAIPTKVTLSGEGLKIGRIEYPKGTIKKFQFSSEELSVYEGEVVIPFTVKLAKDFRGKTFTLRAVVTYQACTDEVCYPPRDKELVMTASVK